MTWICNAPAYAVDIVRMRLPGGFYKYATGPPRDYRVISQKTRYYQH